MAANISDLITRVSDNNTGRPVISQLAAPGKALGATSINISDATNWTTSTVVYFSIYNTTTVGSQVVKDPTTQTDYKGVLAGTTINNIILTGGTDRTYTAGAIVEQTPTARYQKDAYDQLISFSNQDGSLKTSAVQAALNVTGSSADGWTILSTVPTLTSNNGQKEHVLTYSGVDYTDRIQKGTRIKIPRTVAPPSQAMSFTASASQYASKTSPTGYTFTGNWTAEAWIYLNSYTGNNQGVIGHWSGGNGGILMYITGTGNRLCANYLNAGNSTDLQTYQTVPLRQWTHIAVSVNVAAKTASILMNGQSVLYQQVGAATTSYVQPTQPLMIGSFDNAAANTFFDGYIAEARMWNTNLTDTQIRNNMNIALTGSETNLVSLFQGNGNFNDKTSNANNLTAVNGAVATQASNPANAIEYGIVTSVSFAGGNTTIKVFTGTDCNIPNQTLGTTSYSISRAPFGFPVGLNKWIVEAWFRIPYEVTFSALNQDTASNSTLYVPSGDWRIAVHTYFEHHNTTAGPADTRYSLKQASTALPLDRFNSRLYTSYSANTLYLGTSYDKEQFVSLTAPDSFNIFANANSGAGTISFALHGNGAGLIKAECAYI